MFEADCRSIGTLTGFGLRRDVHDRVSSAKLRLSAVECTIEV
jgi:hypothetical protein